MKSPAENASTASALLQELAKPRSPGLTVGEIQQMLRSRRNDLPVRFVTDECLGGGYPEWYRCTTRYDSDSDVLEIVVKDQRA